MSSENVDIVDFTPINKYLIIYLIINLIKYYISII